MSLKSAPRKRKARAKVVRQALVSRDGLVQGWDPYMFVHGDRCQGVSSRRMLMCLNIKGEFTDPIRSITSFVLRLYPEKEPQVNIGTAASIGVWIGMRPSFDGVINVSQREFDFVLAMAQAGKLVSIHTTFQEPYYNRSSISSVSFSCELPLEDPR
ncbi:hypothetical protein ACTJKJ_24080 [Roseateles sp. 22389]|uniref:hypothetical protein n=1 Tax=Roseateles sp. 22389 TaxID=3453916 RepID=UPI00260D67AF|nr:hypothetical protein [uncultured Roseateles sp.]